MNLPWPGESTFQVAREMLVLFSIGANQIRLGLKKKVFDWRNPTDPIYPADPTYFCINFSKKIKNIIIIKKPK